MLNNGILFLVRIIQLILVPEVSKCLNLKTLTGYGVLPFLSLINQSGLKSLSLLIVCSEMSLPKLVLGELFRKVSSFRKFKRIVALVLKVRPAQHKSDKSSTLVLTVDDLARVENCIWSQVQLESFPKEVLSLSSDNVAPSNSQLAPLVPFLNNDLIRARGRLRKASCLSFEQKHPVILSDKHVVVKQFRNDVHVSNAHEGVGFENDGYKNTFHSCSDIISGFRTPIVHLCWLPCLDCR